MTSYQVFPLEFCTLTIFIILFTVYAQRMVPKTHISSVSSINNKLEETKKLQIITVANTNNTNIIEKAKIFW